MRRSFGSTAKIRVKRILEALLVFAVEDPKGELHSSSDNRLQVNSNPQRNQLIVKATTKQIANLTNRYEKCLRKKYSDEVSTWYVADAFEHFQKTLKIFEDLRVRKQGSETWIFRLNLWHSIDEPRKNLDEIDLRLKRSDAEDLINGILEKSQKPQKTKRWWERDLQPLNFTPFFTEKRQYFTGREWIFDEIDVRCVLGNEQALIITGDPGSGKSAFISEFLYRNPQRVIAYHSCHADIEQTIKPGRFVRSIAGMIAQRLDAYATLLSDPSFREGLSESACELDPAGAFEFGILNLLHSLAEPPNDIQFILVDGLDAVISSGEDSASQSIIHLLAGRLKRLPHWLRIIETSRKEAQTLLRLSRQGVLAIEAEDIRNKMDVSRYLDRRLKEPRLIEFLQSSGRSAVDVKVSLSDAGNGNFLYIQQALEGVENNTYSFSELNRLPPGLSSLYLSFLEQSFPNSDSYEQAKGLLQVIAVSKEILSAEQLATVTGMDLEVELYPLLIKLNTYLSHEKIGNRYDGYTFYHKSLIDWLTGDDARQTPYYISVEQGHRLLSETCEKLLLNPKNGWGKYLESYTPFHLIESGYSERLITLLKSFPELIRYTVDTVVNEILNEGHETLCRSRDFLQHLAYSDIYISVILLLEITSRLIESDQEETVRQFINLLEPIHPYYQQIKLILGLQKSSLKIHSNEIFKQIGYALKEKGIPEILKGILQYYLSEYFYFSKKYRMAKRSGEQALRNLSPAISFNHWMKSQFSISRLEIAFGNLSDALTRLSVLQKVAEASNSTNHLAIVYEIRGQIHYEYGQYIEAKNCFQESLELLKENNQSFETIKVLNSLDLVTIKLSDNKD